MKPPALGTVYNVNANLYNKNKKIIATCLDTPNAIAKALMELPTAEFIKEGFINGTNLFNPHLKKRVEYQSRMAAWNVAKSHLKKV